MIASATVISTLSSGRVPFTVTVDERGTVTDVSAPQLRLPESAWRLTYGSKWEEIRAELLHEAAALPYRVEVMIWQSGGKTFRAIRTAFRTLNDQSLDSISLPTEAQELAAFAREYQLVDLFSSWPANFRKALRRLELLYPAVVDYPGRLQPYLLAQLPLQDADTRDRLYTVLGLIGDDRIRELLLSELERPGRHSYTTGLLAGLTKFRDADSRDRILALYEPELMTGEHVAAYLSLLRNLDGPGVEDRILEILGDFPDNGAQVVRTLTYRGWSSTDLAALLRREFDGRDGYFAVLHLLTLVNQQREPAYQIDLATLNARLDRPAFNELPPVSWPQQLERTWRDLLANTDPQLRLDVVEEYLLRDVPRLQRNALLQLVEVQRELREAGARAPLRLTTERRVRELIGARYDKVYTVALKIFGMGTVGPIQEPELLLAALIDRSLQKLYRIMVIQAMRWLVEVSPLTWADVWRRYEELIAGADAGTLSGVEGFLVYLNKHGDTELLREAIEGRRMSISPE